jgi:ornithine cyclodeaminase/alanine dehydrogenase-like protein (mu-crystallin family)
MSSPLLLTRSDIRSLVSWPALMQAVREALLLREAQQVATPVSGQVTMPTALLHLKAGAVFDPGVISVKANLRPEGGVATGIVALFDTKSGQVAAILDSADITAMRTAALAALAVQTLGTPGPKRLALLGAGPVAARIAEVLPSVATISQASVWSRSSARRQAFCAPFPVQVCETPATAACDADIVVTATPSRTAYLHAEDLKPGALLLALGADSPGKRELGYSVLAKASVIADQREDALRNGESAYLPEAERHRVLGDLGAILANKMPLPPRGTEFVVFDSVGSATVDTTVCQALLIAARAKGLGCQFNFSA